MDQALNQKIDAFIAANKEQILQDIAALVAINSVEGEPAEGAPYGVGPRAALDKTLELSAGMGFGTRKSIWQPSAMWTWCLRAMAGRQTPLPCRSRTTI